jgi:Tol biopolymer transport system component
MPDGQYVLVSRSSWGLQAFELWMYHVLGGSGVQVTKAKAKPDQPPAQRHNAIGATVSPDGRYVYYARKTGGFAYNVRFPLWQIARRDLRTGDEDVITRAPGSAFRALVSPDGSQFVYGTRDETQTALRVRDLASGDDRLVAFPVQRDDQESRFTRDLLPDYAFLPGGREVVLSYGGRIHRLDIATGASREIPFSAKVSQQLGPTLHFPLRVEDGPVRARLIQDPVQSPDGERLVFSALTHLYVMDLPAGTPRRLTTGDTRAFQPAWSPDGRWIAFVTWTADGGHLWKVPADSSQAAVQLTTRPAFYAAPAFSLDGTRLVFLRGSRFMRTHAEEEFSGLTVPLDVMWMPADGGDLTLVAPARGLGQPHFTTAEADRLYLYGVGLYQDEVDRA